MLESTVYRVANIRFFAPGISLRETGEASTVASKMSQATARRANHLR
jgi:hypothetical protein